MATLFGVLLAHNTKNRPPLIAKGEIIHIKDIYCLERSSLGVLSILRIPRGEGLEVVGPRVAIGKLMDTIVDSLT